MAIGYNRCEKFVLDLVNRTKREDLDWKSEKSLVYETILKRIGNTYKVTFVTKSKLSGYSLHVEKEDIHVTALREDQVDTSCFESLLSAIRYNPEEEEFFKEYEG